MNEQVLKDLVATAQKYKYDWNVVLPKFPEFKGYDPQLLKDYVATAEKHKYDYDVVNSKFPEFKLKKKEPTVSNSGSNQGGSSSVTQPKEKQKPSGSLSAGAESQFDYTTDITAGSKNEKPVENIFTGYPGKEENEYRVSNGTWQRRMPGQKSWQNVFNEGSVNALNKQFNQSVKYSKAKDLYGGVVEDKKEIAKKELDEKLSSINSRLIDKEEESVVPDLQKQFPDFKFSQSGTFTDEMTVVAPNNESITVSLDNWTSGRDTKEAERLRSFIRMNSNRDLNEAQKKLDEANKQLDQFSIKPFNPTITLGEGYGDEKIITDVNSIDKPTEKPVDMMTADIEAKKARKEYAKQVEITYSDAIDRARVAAETKSDIDDREVANDLAMIKNDWKVSKDADAYFNDISSQSKEIKKQWTDYNTWVDSINNKLATGEIAQGEYDSDYLPKMQAGLDDLKKRSSELNNEYGTAVNLSKAIERSAAENLTIQESRGSVGGGIAYGFTKGLTDVLRVATLGNLSAAAQEDLVRSIVGAGTTEEYMSSEDRSDITKVLFSLSRTLGQAASGGVLGRGASAVGATGKAVTATETVPFFASSYYEMKDQFDDPKFSGISDTQKVLFSAVYGVASGILEKYGLTKAASKTPFGKELTNTILASAIKGLPKDASEQAIKEAIESSVYNKIKSAGVSSLGAFIVEGSTEAAQKASEIALQEAFDGLNKGNYFDNGTGWKMLSDVMYEGYLGGLGGTMMNVASNGARIATEGISKVINKDQEGLLDLMTQMDGINESFDAYLKGKVLSGDISPEEAGVMSKGFREVKAGFDKIPNDIPVEQKTKAFDLIVERSKIEKEISGKEDNLVVAQKERIKEINNELQNISTNAVQKQTTDEVSVQSETTTDQEVDGVKPQVITEESKEEVVRNYTDNDGNVVVNDPSYVVRGGAGNTATEGYYSWDKSEADQYADGNQDNVFEGRIKDDANVLELETNDPSNYQEIAENIKLFEEITGVEYTSENFSDIYGEVRDKLKEAGFDAVRGATIDGLATVVLNPNSIEQPKTITQDAVQKQTTDEGVLQPEGSKVGLQEVEQGDTKQEVVTKEGGKEEVTIDKPVIAKNATTELDRVKSATIDAEDGATLNLDGTKYEGGGLIVPVASTNTTVEEITPEMIADFVEANSGKIGDNNTVKVGVYKFPNSNKVSIDLNIVAPESSRQQAIEFGKMADQESLFDLTTFENVKTGGTGENPMSFTDDQLREVAKALNEGRVPNVFMQHPVAQNEVTLENFSELERKAAEAGDDNRIKVLRAARMATKSLKGVKVFVHNSPEEYQQALANASGELIDAVKAEEDAGRSAGQYVNGEIHIDGTIATSRTVYHEAFHDAIVRTGMSIDLAKGLLKIISDKNLRRQIQDFISQYDKSEQTEEMMSELGAIMAEAETELTTTKLQQFKQLINKLAQKIGLPAIFSEAANSQQAVDFINSMSKSIRTGKAVTEGVTNGVNIDPLSSRKKRMSDPVPGNRLFSEPLKDASRIAYDYSKKYGIDYTDPEKITKLDESNSKAIAEEYDKMKNDPKNPEVRKAYDAMIKETIDQYNEIVKNGYFVEVNNEEPYSSSSEMIADLRDNKRMKIFSTESGFGDEPITDEQRNENPLLQKTEFTDINGVPLLANDLFRFVHDFFGHAKFGNGFGPVGEENAWRIHSAMYSEDARRAMTSETRGQNSWVNFSGVNDKAFKLRDKARELRKEGKTEEANKLVEKVYEEMKFADQKVGLLPDWVSETGVYARKKQKVNRKTVDKSFKNPDKNVIVNEAKALKDQLRLEAKAARESQKDLKQKQRALVVAINQMKRGGLITASQAASLAKRLAYVNVDNPIMVERFLGYAERVFADAEYYSKLNNARDLQRKIKRAIKSDKLQATTVSVAKAFSKINPSLVEDIDEYIENADSVMSAVQSSRTSGLAVELKTAMDFSAIGEYTDRAIEFENEYRKNELLSIYNDLADAKIIAKDMSIEDIKEVIASMQEGKPDAIPAEEKRAYIMSWLGKTADVYRPLIKSILKGVDPFTGDSVTLSDKQQEIMRQFLKIDVTKIDVRDAMAVVEAMDNFITNKVTDGLEAVIARYEGALEAEKLANSGFETRSMNTFGSKKAKSGWGRLWAQEMMSIKTMTDLVFKGVKNAQNIAKSMGLSAYENGVALANKLWNNDLNSYYNMFGKLKPNGEKFMTAKNIYERGMYAALKRTVSGDQKAQESELKRKIKLINDSIATLEKGGDKEVEMAKVYREVADKLGINDDNVSILDIESRVDKINKSAVDWWIRKWADNYNELSDVSQNVYNTILDRDMFYTPDKYSSTKPKDVSVEDVMEANAGAFGQLLNYEYDKKSGVLMPSAKQSSMADGRFMDLNFDMNNSKSLKAAYVDMKTATAIRRISGFLKSKDWEKVMKSKEDRDVFRKKIDNYILRSRNKSTGSIDNDYAQALDKAGRIWASMGASRALGGFTQPFKQTIPVMVNTIVNAGRFDVAIGSEKNAWINAIGRGVSNRGLESQSGFEDANRLLDNAVNSGNTVKILTAIDKANTAVLRTVLAKPDVFVARSSFISYYKQYMKQNGLPTEINYNRPEEANQDALDYAQRMVDRQQNVSDSDMAGELMASQKPDKKIIRNVVLPFASFALNQKSRMFSDFATVFSRKSGASLEDIILAGRSLAGLGVEIFVFNTMAYWVSELVSSVANYITGNEDDEEEKEKKKERRQGYLYGNIVSNTLSPAPVFDEWVISGSDAIYKKLNSVAKATTGEAEKALAEYNADREENGARPLTGKEADRWKEAYIEEDRIKILGYKSEGVGGTYRITLDKLNELSESYDLAFNGEYKDDRDQNKYVLKEDRETLKWMWFGNLAYNLAGFPAEYSSLNRRVENNIKKKAGVSEKKFDTYNDVVAHKGGKGLNKVELFLVKNMDGTKSQSGTERVIDEIEWIKNNGGFENERQMDKYIEIYKKEGSVGSSDMKEIQKIK